MNHWWLIWLLAVFGVFEDVRDFFAGIGRWFADASALRHKRKLQIERAKAKAARNVPPASVARLEPPPVVPAGKEGTEHGRLQGRQAASVKGPAARRVARRSGTSTSALTTRTRSSTSPSTKSAGSRSRPRSARSTSANFSRHARSSSSRSPSRTSATSERSSRRDR